MSPTEIPTQRLLSILEKSSKIFRNPLKKKWNIKLATQNETKENCKERNSQVKSMKKGNKKLKKQNV